MLHQFVCFLRSQGGSEADKANISRQMPGWVPASLSLGLLVQELLLRASSGPCSPLCAHVRDAQHVLSAVSTRFLPFASTLLGHRIPSVLAHTENCVCRPFLLVVNNQTKIFIMCRKALGRHSGPHGCLSSLVGTSGWYELL